MAHLGDSDGERVDVPVSCLPEDHSYGSGNTKKRMWIQNTKKVGCKAKLILKMLIRFPAYKIDRDSVRARRSAIQKLRKDVLTQADQSYRVLVRVYGPHNDHEVGENARFGLPLVPLIKAKIKELVMTEGLRGPSEIKNHLAIHVKGLDTTCESRRFCPTLRDIRNQMYSLLNTNRFRPGDQENVLGLVQGWKEDYPTDNFFFEPMRTEDDGDVNSLLFVHQSSFQRRLLLKYGRDIVLMDATYKTTKYNLPLYFLAVLTNVGYYIVASFIVGHENYKEIAAGLNVILSWNPGWKPGAFMCDLDQREILAVESCFEDCKVFTCLFHREQAWSRWLSKRSNQCWIDKEQILKQLRRLAGSKTLAEMETNADTVKASTTYLNIKFQRWFDNVWMKNNERWIRCFKTSSMEVLVSTTNGIESLNNVFKKKYQKKNGPRKQLSALLSTLVEEFVPEYQEKYLQQNLQTRETCKKYNEEVPLFLNNRPRPFVQYCMKRWGKISQEDIKERQSGFHVSGYEVQMDTPSCSCPDFLSSGWPCKHILGVVKYFPDHGWDFMPEVYRNLPVFNLDEGDAVLEVNCTPTVPPRLESKQLRQEALALVDELKGIVHMVPECTVQSLKESVQNVVHQFRNEVPNVEPIPIRSQKKRKTTGNTNSVSFTATPLPAEDEIAKALSDIWGSPETEDAVVIVGPYTIYNNSFHYIMQNLPDEVIDASLYLLCRRCDENVKHVPTSIWSSIFCQQTPAIHGFLTGENLDSYETMIGDLNEGRHWILLETDIECSRPPYNPVGKFVPEEYRGHVSQGVLKAALVNSHEMKFFFDKGSEWKLFTSRHSPMSHTSSKV